MIHQKLIQPKSIVVIGGSDNIHSPGGSVLKNLIDHYFSGNLFVVNPKKEEVQGIKSYQSVSEIPKVDVAIIAIAARFVFDTVKVLTEEKETKGFIIFSAGFAEKDNKGLQLENKIAALINKVGGTLLGPNNIGLINKYYAGVFTKPIPKLDNSGVDFISGSGATAVFIMEAAQSFGLTFSSVYTVGNSAQIGVEEVLEYFDTSFEKGENSLIKLLYIESIKNPVKFLKHTTSLIKKGCKLAAIKAGSSEAGSKAASSHTGAIANSDVFVEALFKKAGIIRCHGRHELISIASILTQNISKGKNIAIVTHAGGPAVMLTDVLSKNGLKVPSLKGVHSEALLQKLFDGSSVNNPIDFLATGNAEQLDIILDYCENKFDEIDAIAVIFGSPGLDTVEDVYAVLHNRIKTSKKPIYAILPSVINVKKEINNFLDKGNIVFNDEVLFGSALCKVYNHVLPKLTEIDTSIKVNEGIRNIINQAHSGYLSQELAVGLLESVGIKFIPQYIVKTKQELLSISRSLKYPVVQKVNGPLHKSDVGGVILNVSNEQELVRHFDMLIDIKGAHSVLIQPMISGMEIFIGAKKEGAYPHIVLCGLGGIFVEVLKDVNASMIPISHEEAKHMITELKAYPILKGTRGKKGIHLDTLAHIIEKVSQLLFIAPEIAELDINPLLANENDIIAVDTRIRIEK
jgi:acyl-CoA synthetase (NDP forming)